MSSWITTTPGTASWMTPCQTSKPASVTTNDGTPIRATNDPWSAPIAVVARIARAMQMYHARSGPRGSDSWSLATTTPAMPLTNAIERSISPMRSTKMTP